MTKRLFIAINIPVSDEVKSFVSKIQRQFIGDKIKWVPLVNFHLTIKFLGDTDIKLIPEITRQIKDAVKNIHSFDIYISGLGKFSKAKHAKVIWLGVQDNSGNLEKIFKSINNNLLNLGFSSQYKFSPHITLGRIKSIHNEEVLDKLTNTYSDKLFQTTTVSDVILYESILKPSGAVYNVVEKVSLSKLQQNN